jgi:hypothetical protein
VLLRCPSSPGVSPASSSALHHEKYFRKSLAVFKVNRLYFA